MTNVRRAKIVSEAKPVPSQFTDDKGNVKMQDACKVQFEGLPEPLNTKLNRATIGGLVQAFGKDSREWMNHPLTVLTEKGKVSGRSVVYLFLIPQGYKKIEDAGGYDVIVPESETEVADVPPIEDESGGDIPF